MDSTEREIHRENTVGAEEMQSLSGLSQDQELAVSVIDEQVDQGGKRKDAILDSHDGNVLGSSASASKGDRINSRLRDGMSLEQAGPTTLSDIGSGRLYTDVVAVSLSANDGFVTVARKSVKRRSLPSNGASTPKLVAAPLTGACRVFCKAFHVSRLSLDTWTDDVLAHIKMKGVTATGCYSIRTKVWGTASMKVFIDKAAEQTVLSADFWPEHVRCCEWLKAPPTGSQKGLSPAATHPANQ